MSSLLRNIFPNTKKRLSPEQEMTASATATPLPVSASVIATATPLPVSASATPIKIKDWCKKGVGCKNLKTGKGCESKHLLRHMVPCTPSKCKNKNTCQFRHDGRNLLSHQPCQKQKDHQTQKCDNTCPFRHTK